MNMSKHIDWSLLCLFSIFLQFLILQTNFVEPFHVLLEVRPALQSDEQLCFLCLSVISAWNADSLRVDLLEYSVVVPIDP